jgi:hypothetical protein
MPTHASPHLPGRSWSWATGTLLVLMAVLLGSSVLPSAASAARSVTFASMFEPLSQLGEGTITTTELTFSGSEYGGQVDPLTGLTIHLPAGTGLSDVGFPTCGKATLEEYGPYGCPNGSLAGPPGSMKLEAYLGPKVVEEEATVQPVFGTGGVLYFFVDGGPPVYIEVIAEGHYVSDSPPYGQDLVLNIPTIETVPGAPDASITALTLHLGSAREESGVVFNYVSVPSTCPSGKFAWASDAAFNGGASEPVGVTETACPAAGSRQATTTSLSVSNATPLRGETVTYTATVTPNSSGPVPSGGVTFFDDGSAITGCSARSLTQYGASATATCQASYAAYGAHTIGAAYGGDANYLGSSSGTDNVVLTAEAEEVHNHHEEEATSKTTTTGGSTTGSSTPSGASSSPGSGTPVATMSSAQIAASLAKQLVPAGKAARITALLKAGGLTMSFTALEAGTLSVQWYEVPAGAKLAKHSKAKPVLVASGQATFSAAGVGKLKIRLTAQGKKLLKHGKGVKVEVKGVFGVRGGVAVSATRGIVLRG